jgi:protein-disulfide isomerase
MSTLKIPVTSKDHLKGQVDAACCLVEYGDYECPSCGAAQPMIRDLQLRFGGRLSVVFRNFPLSEMHPNAEPAAEVAEFASDHDLFWKMHDLLFDHQGDLGDELFHVLADRLGLVDSELQMAVYDKLYAKRIEADFAGGVRSGVNGTPTFFLNGERFDGPANYASFVRAIEQTLAS